METIGHNIAYDLLLKKTKLSSNPINTEGEINNVIQPINHVYFVICNSCYWCASYFGTDNMESLSHVLNCNVCNSHTELIPKGTDESFRIKYNHARGMEIEFYKSHK
jgi:hypothetical protein